MRRRRLRYSAATPVLPLLAAIYLSVIPSGVAGIGAEPILPEPTALGATHSEPVRSELTVRWETVLMRVTGYCPCPKCCGKHSDGITASGHEITHGDTFVAADRRYGFGTRMIVPGYNDSKPVDVLDRGGAIRGDRLDVFFDSHEQARQWGVRYLAVKVRVD
ncbi:MAG: 3D domain-containing protein [Sedimentisphaerales bacterium]|jgi:3D (Asp-Asp-Asp) domain-containing protein